MRKYGPFNTSVFYEVENRRLQRAFNQETGFVKSGQGAVTAGTGAELVIAAYPDGALIDGLYVENPASETVTLTTNTASTNPRIDRLVLRLNMTAKTIAPFQIVGTPAASPSAPSLTQTSTTYDMPLCQYRFPGSASAQNPTSIVDERLVLPRRSRVIERTAGSPGTVASGATSIAGPFSFTVHTAGTWLLNATFRAGGPGAAICWVEIDGTQIGYSAVSRTDVTVPVVGSVALAAGSHTVSMKVNASGGSVGWIDARVVLTEGAAE